MDRGAWRATVPGVTEDLDTSHAHIQRHAGGKRLLPCLVSCSSPCLDYWGCKPDCQLWLFLDTSQVSFPWLCLHWIPWAAMSNIPESYSKDANCSLRVLWLDITNLLIEVAMWHSQSVPKDPTTARRCFKSKFAFHKRSLAISASGSIAWFKPPSQASLPRTPKTPPLSLVLSDDIFCNSFNVFYQESTFTTFTKVHFYSLGVLCIVDSYQINGWHYSSKCIVWDWVHYKLRYQEIWEGVGSDYREHVAQCPDLVGRPKGNCSWAPAQENLGWVSGWEL